MTSNRLTYAVVEEVSAHCRPLHLDESKRAVVDSEETGVLTCLKLGSHTKSH